MRAATGVAATRVPYRGGVQVMPDLINGQLQLNFGPIVSGLPHLRAGKLRALMTLGAQRHPLLPDVPCSAELGVPPADLPTWNAVFAPPRTPRAVADRIAADVAAALRQPAVRTALEQQAATPIGGTPQQLAEAVESADRTWKAFVKAHAVPME